MSSDPFTTRLPELRLRMARRTMPDVPEDVQDALEHLNDPYYEPNAPKYSPDSSIDSFELGLGDKKTIRLSNSIEGFDLESRCESTLGRPSTPESTVVTQDKSALTSETSTTEYEDDSPYPEVRAAVSSIDDPYMPVNTFRAWFLGILFTVLLSAANQYFTFRFPAIGLTSLFIQIIALPAGKFLAWILPECRFRVFGVPFSFNPGPFNIKEHALITMMSKVVEGGIYTTSVTATQKVVFNQDFGFGYQFLLAISSQIIGYSFAGFARRFLVWPSSMVWPGALVTSALLNTLHRTWNIREKRHMSRSTFFGYAFVGAFVWYWFPGFIFTALSVFNWVCWIAPQNIVVNQLFGTSTGLGMGLLTFDWTQISLIGSPLVQPWWAQVNTFVGFIFFFWFLTPILYYKNVFYAKFLPMSTIQSFDNTGLPFDFSRVIAPDGSFDRAGFLSYSPLFMPMTLALSYGISFAVLTSTIVHFWLWYRHSVIRQFRTSWHEQRDVHSRLMRAYKEVPDWWYGAVGIVAFVFALVSITVFSTGMPVWTLFVCFLITAAFVLPVGIIQALTNQTITLNILSELLFGYMAPGRPVALMLFKGFSTMSLATGLTFVGDLKLGHYMKIPPRLTFSAQLIATLVCALVSVGVQNWLFSTIPDICTPDQPDHLSCPNVSAQATASMIWGGIGPKHFFSPGALYYPMVWFFLIGALLPIPFYYAAHRFPRSWLKYVNIPVFFVGLQFLPPANGINYISFFIVGFIFQYWMRKYHFFWWMRYNYILSAALDSGTAFGIGFVFLTLGLRGVQFNWWGNTVWQNTADAMGLPFTPLAPNSTFGPLPIL